MWIKWTELADRDLVRVEAHIAEDNSPIVAIEVVLRIIDAVEMILPEHPNAGRPGRLKGTRELAMNGIPFIVVYRKVKGHNRLEMLRVLLMPSNGHQAAERRDRA